VSTLRRTIIRATVAVALAAGGVAVVAAPAYAADSSLDVSGTTISYSADVGVTNVLTVTNPALDTYLFVDTGGDPIVSSDPACTYPVAANTTRMQCVAAGIVTIEISVSDLEDTVNHRTDRAAVIYGGSGSDTISVGGRAGVTSYVYASSGNDRITSGAGNDVISGSTGTDTVVYTGSSPVTASLTTNTGVRAGDSDTFTSVENLTGGTGNDTLIGNNSANVLDGGSALLCTIQACSYFSGNDTMFGLGGEDEMHGRYGDDWMWGGDADDMMYGEDGNDHLDGDDNVIYNSLFGGPGTDDCDDGEQLDCES
jgi:Ca2+-binding RTX toxin-like protein